MLDNNYLKNIIISFSIGKNSVKIPKLPFLLSFFGSFSNLQEKLQRVDKND